MHSEPPFRVQWVRGLALALGVTYLNKRQLYVWFNVMLADKHLQRDN